MEIPLNYSAQRENELKIISNEPGDENPLWDTLLNNTQPVNECTTLR